MLQRKDSNLRPLAYETSKLPTAPRCDVAIHILHRQRIAVYDNFFFNLKFKIHAKLTTLVLIYPHGLINTHLLLYETNFGGRAHTTTLCLVISLHR